MTTAALPFALHPDEQWCGGTKDEKRTLEERLLDFTVNKWGNKAFDFLVPAVICDPAFQVCYSGNQVGTIVAVLRRHRVGLLSSVSWPTSSAVLISITCANAHGTHCIPNTGMS